MTGARLILALADGWTYREISQRLGCIAPVISLWRRRFAEQRLDGLFARHQCRRPAPTSTELEARILEATRKPQPDGGTHSSDLSRKLLRHIRELNWTAKPTKWEVHRRQSPDAC